MAMYRYITCQWCRNSVKRQVRGTRDARLFCSRDCSFASGSNLNLERDSMKRIVAKQRKRAAKAIREAEKVARKEQRAIKKLKEIEQMLNCECKDCGLDFKQRTHIGLKEKYCSYCRKQRLQKERRIHKSRRRARIRGAEHDAIDPIDVFKQADWICYICGQNTPRALRGTWDNRAPELDHVIPLSKGGTHTLDNVACSCRRCNIIKADN